MIATQIRSAGRKFTPFFFFNLVGLNIFLSLAYYVASLHSAEIRNFFDSYLALSLGHFGSFKLWTILTYFMFETNLVSLLGNLLLLIMTYPRIRRILPPQMIAQVCLGSALTGGFFHMAIAPSAQVITGLTPLTFAFVYLTGFYYGKKPALKFRNVFVNWNMIIFILTIALIIVIARGGFSESSIPALAGAFVFVLFYTQHLNKHFIPLVPEEDPLPPPPPPQPTRYMQEPFSQTSSAKAAPGREEIDRILDKISEKGIQSLSNEEKEKLKKASEGMKGAKK